jgi:nicotinate-nucleotide adenylyltransferase
MKRPIGLLGGTFDPVHYGHLAVAHLAFEHFKLHTLFLIPSGTPPHKHDAVHVAARHRVRMLQLALTSDSPFKIYRGELARKGFSYTVETVRYFSKHYPGRQLFFIIGSDNLKELKTWHRYTEILDTVTLCVTHRPGYSMSIPPECARGTILTFPSPEWGISSSRLRALLKNGYTGEYLIPGPVRRYIETHTLYS